MDPSNRRLIVLLVLVVLVAIGLLLVKRAQREPSGPTIETTPAPQVQPDSPQVEVAPPQPQATARIPEVRQQLTPAPEPTQQPTPEPTPQADTHTRVHENVAEIRIMLNDYQTRTGGFPATLNALGALPKDPWQRDYIYQSPSSRNRESYDLFSAGPDGRPDTPDDDWGEEGAEESPKN